MDPDPYTVEAETISWSDTGTRYPIRPLCCVSGLVGSLVFGPPGSGPAINCTDPDPDPSMIEQKKKNLDFYSFVTSL